MKGFWFDKSATSHFSFVYFFLLNAFVKAQLVCYTRKPGTRVWAVAGVPLRQRSCLGTCDLCGGRCRHCIHSVLCGSTAIVCKASRGTKAVSSQLCPCDCTRTKKRGADHVRLLQGQTMTPAHRWRRNVGVWVRPDLLVKQHGLLQKGRFLSDASCSTTECWAIFHPFWIADIDVF